MFTFKELSPDDDIDIFKMLKEIGEEENSFTNPVASMSFKQFKEWLLLQHQWSKAINLPNNYVIQTIYWLYVDGIPVGFGKIRNELTDISRQEGGNIGYAISNRFRNRGYGKILLSFLIEEAKRKKIGELLLTIRKNNYASKKVVEENGGLLTYENDKWWYYTIK